VSAVEARHRSPIWDRVLDALPVAVVVIDEDGKVVAANDRAGEILGCVPEDIAGCAIEELAPGWKRLRPSESATPTPAPADDGRFEFDHLRPDGTIVSVGLRESALPPDPETGRLRLLCFQDVTPIRRVQQERDRLLQLAAVSEVMPSVLHELKNPLAAATAALEIALEEATSGQLQLDLHAILCELRRALLTLDGVGLLRPTGVRVRHGAVDLALSETFRILDGQMRGKGLTGRCAVPALPLLPLDPSLVRALVFNLLNNPIQACRRGDAIELSARLRDGALEVVVADTGPGMTPEVLARCRELFFTTRPSGSGVGLALCQSVAQAAGGSLEIASERGSGTRVTVVLPVASADRQEPSRAEGRSQHAGEEPCHASRI
jgi:two-component system, NtrC family, sensor histidine kinase HydH